MENKSKSNSHTRLEFLGLSMILQRVPWLSNFLQNSLHILCFCTELLGWSVFLHRVPWVFYVYAGFLALSGFLLRFHCEFSIFPSSLGFFFLHKIQFCWRKIYTVYIKKETIFRWKPVLTTNVIDTSGWKMSQTKRNTRLRIRWKQTENYPYDVKN